MADSGRTIYAPGPTPFVAFGPLKSALTASTVATVTLDVGAFSSVEVLNVDGTAAIYFTTDGTTPTVAGNGCSVLPAAIGALTLDLVGYVQPTVKLISEGSPKVSVRGLRQTPAST